MKPNPRVLYPLGVLAAGALIATGLYAARPSPKVEPPQAPPPLVRAHIVNRADVRMVVRSQGTVTARTESTLLSQVAGQVVAVSPAFASGGFFSAGDVLIEIDPRDYELAVARARAQVAQAEVRLIREEEEVRLAQEEWRRLGSGEPTDLVLRKPQLQEARASLAAARAAEQQAALNLERTQVRAPYDGRVLARSVDVGQFVGPGAPVGRIYAVDYAEIRLPIPHDELAYLDLGLSYAGDAAPDLQPTVRLSGDFAGERHSWEGRIVRVEGQIDPMTRMVNLVARVADPYGRLAEAGGTPLVVGLFVQAEIAGRTAGNVAEIPRSALRGPDRVLVIDAEDRLRFRDVDVMRTDARSVLVRRGLADGERVCVSPLDAVVEGMKVRVSEGASPGAGEGSA